jgi:hypothetical protein
MQYILLLHREVLIVAAAAAAATTTTTTTRTKDFFRIFSECLSFRPNMILSELPFVQT